MKEFLQTGLIWLGCLATLFVVCLMTSTSMETFIGVGTTLAFIAALLSSLRLFRPGLHEALLPVAIMLGIRLAYLAMIEGETHHRVVILILIVGLVYLSYVFARVTKYVFLAPLLVSLLIAATAAGISLSRSWVLVPTTALLYIWRRVAREEDRLPSQKPLSRKGALTSARYS